jgi:hypothetical protein
MFTMNRYRFACTLVLLALISAPVAATETGGVHRRLIIPLAGTVFYGLDTIELSGDGRIDTEVVMNENATQVMVHVNLNATETGGINGIGSVTGNLYRLTGEAQTQAKLPPGAPPSLLPLNFNFVLRQGHSPIAIQPVTFDVLFSETGELEDVIAEFGVK